MIDRYRRIAGVALVLIAAWVTGVAVVFEVGTGDMQTLQCALDRSGDRAA